MLACARNTRARYKCILESWLLIIASPSSRKKRKGGERVQIIIKRRKEDGRSWVSVATGFKCQNQ